MEYNSNRAERLIQSLKKETRCCILECAVFLEERASATLARLLEIERKESESLGYGSASLGFDNKIRLIQDLKGVKKQDKAKFQSYMAIRNKFAHIAEIDSFANYFQIIPSSKERKKELIKWFPNLKWSSDDIEGLYKFAYFTLTLSLFEVLFQIDIEHAYDKGKAQGCKEAKEKFINDLKERLEETEKRNEFLEVTIEKLLNRNSG